MKLLISIVAPVTAPACCTLDWADVLPDRIFSSNFAPVLRSQGKAAYAGPLANANVEVHFGAPHRLFRDLSAKKHGASACIT